MSAPTITKVNIYRSNGEWCYSAWKADGEWDSSDPLGITDECTSCEAEREARVWFPGAEITKVPDITTPDGLRSDDP